jgi:hypothetical protein
MGLPATTAGQTQLAAISPDNKNVYPGGCVFACHFSQKMCTTIAKPSTAQACQGYNLAQSNNIELRAAAVGSAVQSLLSTATATETITNQYRVGAMSHLMLKSAKRASLIENLRSLRGFDKMLVR